MCHILLPHGTLLSIEGLTLEVTMIYPYREQLDCHYIIKVFHSSINFKGNNLYPALYSALTLIFPNKAEFHIVGFISYWLQ